MQCLLAQAAQKFSSLPALISSQKILTYAQFEQSVTATVSRLEHLGIKPDARIAIQGDNSLEYLIFLIALWRMKATACLLSTRLPISAIDSQMKMLNCKKLFRSFEYVVMHLETYEFKITRKRHIPLNHETTIMFTSGSTGTPKAAVHTYVNHYYSALGSNKNISVKPNDRWLLSLPLYHVGGLSILFRCLLGGAAIIITNSTKNLAELITQFKITHVSVVPAQLYRLLKENPSNLSSLKSVLVGGAPIPENLIQKSLQRKLPIYITYGLTEMASQVATSTKADLQRRKMDSAKVLAYRQLRVSAEGEILVKGKTLFKGYYHSRGIRKFLQRDGWFATGDLGKFHKGRLRVFGRKDNMFISGGENIQPEEIEKYLKQMPAICDARVVPAPDAKFGQRPVAFIKRRTGGRLTTKTIQQYLANFLPRHKIPIAFYDWTPHQNNKNFKINRWDLPQRITKLKNLQKLRPRACPWI